MSRGNEPPERMSAKGLKEIYGLTNVDGVHFHYNLEEELKTYAHTIPVTVTESLYSYANPW